MHGADKRMSQPAAMKTNAYVGGVEKVNGHDAWALFKACAAGDMPKAKALLAKDRRLINASFSYRLPIHLAVRAGHAEIVKLLLDQGAVPSEDMLLAARERGHRQVEGVLRRAMSKRFGYSPDFDELKEAIIARDSRKIGAVLRRQPNLARASDARGNNALHWSVITRQLDLIERFAALGTPIDAERADGQTPALIAANGGCNSYRAARDQPNAAKHENQSDGRASYSDNHCSAALGVALQPACDCRVARPLELAASWFASGARGRQNGMSRPTCRRPDPASEVIDENARS